MKPSIVIVGSLNMDFLVRTAILPSPGETVLGNGFEMIPGGKGANQAVAIRKLFDGRPLVPGIKALIAHTQADSGWARTMPPLAPVSAQDRTAILSGHDGLRARRVA